MNETAPRGSFFVSGDVFEKLERIAMKQCRPFPQAVITKKGARFLAEGNVWVFDAEVLRVDPAPLDGREVCNGDVVEIGRAHV